MAETPQGRRSSSDKEEESTSTANTSVHAVAGRDNPQAPQSSIDLAKEETGHDANPSGLEEKDDIGNSPWSPDFNRPFGNARWALTVLGFCLGAFLYGLDTTIAADVQGPILKSLGEIEKLPWVGIGFPMGSVAVILLIGVSNGLFNIKILYIVSLIIFEVGSATCGAAPNMNAMICGRIIAGMGGAGIYIGALTYISIFTSHMERPIYNALIGLCWGTGCIVGPIIGGGFSSSSATWRWAFYINLPLAACCSPIYVFLFPNFNPRPDTPLRTKIAQIDWVGVVLNAIVFTFFQVVLTLAGSTWRWDSAGPIVFWVFFGICLIVFALQQVYCVFTTPEHRLFPVQFLKHRTHVLLYFATACSATTTFVTIYYVPLFFQFTKGDTAIHAAVRLLPFITVMVTFVMFSGGSLPKVGRYMPYYIASGALMIIGAALMHTVDSQTSEGKIYGYEVLLAAGAGLSLQTAYTVIVVKVLPQEVPAGIGFINVAQIGSITIALSIAGSIFQNMGFRELSAALAQFNFSEADLRNALGGVESTILADAGQVQTLALEAIVRTISKIWIMSIAAGALCFVSGILMSPEKLELEMTAGG